MKVFLGTDHRGFRLAEELVLWLNENNVAMTVVGAHELDPTDDYVDFAADVAKRVAQVLGHGHEETRGIVICGSGVGVDVAANKIKGIRSGLGFSKAQVQSARSHDDINVLALAADYVDVKTAKEMVKVFLETPFSNEERHVRRIRKVAKLEHA